MYSETTPTPKDSAVVLYGKLLQKLNEPVVPAYVRTAFLSSAGNDGTAQLNEETLPYLTLLSALTALNAAFSGQPVTVRLLSDIGAGQTNVPAGIAAALTIMSHTGTRTLTQNLRCSSTIGLTFDNCHVAEVTYADNPAHSVTNAGTITFMNGATLTQYYAVGAVGADGSVGDDGTDETGNDGSPGMDGEIPTGGSAGEGVQANAGPGGNGSPGGFGRSIIFDGPGVIENFDASGGNGGAGGMGGNGTTATGGAGGAGGNATGPSENDGGAGGDGGNASATGGAGGDGADGGDGGNATLLNGAIITNFTSNAGSGGSLGQGGGGGTASAGAGGSGGAGFGSGQQGGDGNTGASDPSGGPDGSAGQNGAPGQQL